MAIDLRAAQAKLDAMKAEKAKAAQASKPMSLAGATNWALKGIGEGMGKVGTGIVKGALSTASGASELGEKMLGVPMAAMGMKNSLGPSLGTQVREAGVLKPKGALETAGFGAEQIGEFFVPGAGAAKAEKLGGKLALEGLPMLAGKGTAKALGREAVKTGVRAGIEAGVGGGIEALHQGDINKQVGQTAAFSAAIPVAGSVLKGVKTALSPSVDKAVQEGIEKGVKPYFSHRGATAEGKAGYMAKAKEAINTIVEHKPTFTDEAGIAVQRMPQNRSELLDAIGQAKKKVFETYHQQAVAAGEAGAAFDSKNVAHKLWDAYQDKGLSPEVRNYAFKLLDDINELHGAAPEVVEKRIAEYNDALSGYYQGNRVDRAKAQVDASVANAMREELDKVIENASGPGYQGFKNKYGALKTLEKDVARQVAVEARKNPKGLIDFTDIFTGGDILGGLVTGNPYLVAKGVAGKGIKEGIKHLNDPNRFIANMFKALEAEKLPPRMPGPTEARIFGTPDRVPGPAVKAPGPGAAGADMVGKELPEELPSQKKLIEALKKSGHLYPEEAADMALRAAQEEGVSFREALKHQMDMENLGISEATAQKRADKIIASMSGKEVTSTGAGKGVNNVKAASGDFERANIEEDLLGERGFASKQELNKATRIAKSDTSIEVLDPNEIKPSEWNNLGPSKKKLASFTKESLINSPPVLVERKYGGDLEVIDGLHRVEAAKKFGLPIRAIVIGTDTAQNLSGFSDTFQYKFLHSIGKDLYESGIPIKAPAAEEFKGFNDLSTKTLEKLKGRSIVSKQFISDLTNAPDLKQAERDAIRTALEGEGANVDVKKFAEKVKGELLPLKRKSSLATKNLDRAKVLSPMEYSGSPHGDYGYEIDGVKSKTSYASKRDAEAALDRLFRKQPGYESTSLQPEVRGDVADYSEHVYESPIKTSAGSVHPNLPKSEGYFAHTRVEDMADGKTRRVIEAQSDLFQKGRLEGERGMTAEQAEYVGKKAEAMGDKNEPMLQRYKETAKLEPYRNTWHERIVREEVKQAAKDGKKVLQFPTGETAMKIEGLGLQDGPGSWVHVNPHPSQTSRLGRYTVEGGDLKVGLEIKREGQDPWVITDVLGDGKFKAVPKEVTIGPNRVEINKVPKEQWANFAEQFDISGKVDENNPIYRFYEKEIGKYLKNKYGATRITDPQGVSWYQLNVKPEHGKLPIEAYALAPLAATPLTAKKEKKQERKK